MVFFWACEVTAAKAAVVKIPESYVLNVCHATLTFVDGSKNADTTSVGIETTQMDGKPWKGVVTHLNGATVPQVKLDLVFGTTTQVKFFLAAGTGKVNLTGYFQPGPSADMFDESMAPLEVISVADETSTATTAGSVSKKSKKRARDDKHSVAWDQAASSDSEEGEKPTTAKETPSKKQVKKEVSHVAAKTSSNGAGDGEASGTKKKKNRKNKNKNKKDN